MQQYNKASRPRLSEADDIVLKLVLRALGERHYLTASLVCRAWREAYGASVQQSKVTCCKPYLEDAAMWLHIKELGSHEGIPTALFGQYACDIALNDKLEAALSKIPTREMPRLTVQVAPKPNPASLSTQKRRANKEWSKIKPERSDSMEDLYEDSELVGIDVNLTEKDFVVPTQTPEQLEAERTAKLEAERAANALAERIAKLEVACFTETIAPIVAGAASAGRYAVCSSTLAKLPRTTQCVFSLLQASLVRELADSAAKCKDAAAFTYVLRVLLMVSHAGAPVELDCSTGMANRSGTESARKWQKAAVCSAHCDTDVSLQQFAKLMEIQFLRGDRITVITEQLDTSAAVSAVTMLLALWGFYDTKGALTWALARCGIPVLHARFIRECAAEEPLIVEELVHKVAQKGSVQVLEHLLQEGLITGIILCYYIVLV
jgi:hypothetical protein